MSGHIGRFLVGVCVLFAVFGDGHKSHKCKHKSTKSKSSSDSGHMHKAPKCKRLKSPQNGRIVTTATVVCDDGYVINGNEQISCNEDGEWSDELGTCVVDPCLSDPCENGGTCVADGLDYECQCTDLYEGFNCSEVVDPCESGPCKNGGTCVADGLDYECQCTDLYEGFNCSQMVDPCESGPCKNGGTCVADGLDYECQCTDLYEGYNCSQMVDPCESGPCKNGGTCVADGLDYECQCTDLYEGFNCSQMVDSCESGPCENGGTCVADGLDYECQCTPFFTGMNCTEAQDPCLTEPCANGGTCVTADFTCLCPPLFGGLDCSIDCDKIREFKLHSKNKYKIACVYQKKDTSNRISGCPQIAEEVVFSLQDCKTFARNSGANTFNFLNDGIDPNTSQCKALNCALPNLQLTSGTAIGTEEVYVCE